MELLPADRFAAEPDDLVHREATFSRGAVVVVCTLVGGAWLGVPLLAGPWGFLAWLIGLPTVGCAALMWPGVVRGFQSEHWAVRLRPGGIALRVRSFLNDDLPSEEPTVCWIRCDEIRGVRRGRTERRLPGDRHDQLVVEQHLDIQLAHADTRVLAEVLAREQHAPRRGRAHHHVYPVRLVAPDVVRVTWSDPRLALRPRLAVALEFLEQHVRVEPPLELALDWRELTDAQVADLVRELTRMGARMDAIRLLRERGGLDHARAKQLVDQIAA